MQFGFDFEVPPQIKFNPKVVVKNVDQQRISSLGKEVLNSLAFGLGLMEIPSYWKATCSPEVIIRAGLLSPEQILWWRDLLLQGLGQFFYTNQIDFTGEKFVNFRVEAPSPAPTQRFTGDLDQRALVLIGGGKDSAVSAEWLKRGGRKMMGWALNPTPAALETARVGQYVKLLTVERAIDKTLLRLNEEGYLNGHTPFSAYLAFLSSTSAILANCAEVVASNERSADEGNLDYLGEEINHQYSKSYQFEKGFREYLEKYLAAKVNYFSFLRPLYELQVARLFSRLPQYFPVIRSCNRGQKNNTWCQQCPKCLFVFTILYPFVEEKVLTSTIFAENLFAKEQLGQMALELLGQRRAKPFECVGTVEETLVAFYLCLKKARQKDSLLPPVLRLVEKKVLAQEKGMEMRARVLLGSWNEKNFLPRDLADLLLKERGV